MASSSQPASATPQSDTAKSTATCLGVYNVTFYAQYWSHGVTLLDGRPPINEDSGTLDAFSTQSEAQDVATKWAIKQVQDHLRKDHTSLQNERDIDAAFDEWEEAESIQDNHWRYVISKGAESLCVRVEEVVLLDPHDSGSSEPGWARTVGVQGNGV